MVKWPIKLYFAWPILEIGLSLFLSMIPHLSLIHVSILNEQSKLMGDILSVGIIISTSDLTKCQTNAKVGRTRPDIMEYSKKSILIIMLTPSHYTTKFIK